VPAIAAIFWAQTNLTKMVQRVGEFKLFHTCTRDALEVIAVLLIVYGHVLLRNFCYTM
jgi:hypothetical protein